MVDKYDPNQPSDLDEYFRKASEAHGVSYDLLRKVGWIESRFKPTAVSPTKPRGVMQFTKATGQAYGLQTDNDFFDPAKSIDAGARCLKDLVQQYDGDELKAALAYNQGGGRLGKPQLEAYDKGDFGAISKEGRGYLTSLMDVAQSPRKGDLETYQGGITPKSQPVEYKDAMSGLQAETKVSSTDLPESQGFSVKGKEQPPAAVPFDKAYWESKGTTLDEAEQRSTFFGFKSAADAELSNSTLGVAYRAARVDNSFNNVADAFQPAKYNTHIFTPEELEKIRTEVKNPAYINSVLGSSPDTLDETIKRANENYEKDAKALNAGVGARLSAGVIGAAGDPLTYVPMAGMGSKGAKGFKLINKALMVGSQAALTNVTSEALRTSVAGGDAHYTEAALSGLIAAGGLSMIADGVAKGMRKGGSEVIPENPYMPSAIRYEARETARNAGTYDGSKMPISDEHIFENHNGVDFTALKNEPGAVALRDGTILSDTNIANPMTQRDFNSIDPDPDRAFRGASFGAMTELGYTILRSENPKIRGIGGDLVRSPTGMRSGSNGKFSATSSDIKDRLSATDNMDYNKLTEAMRTALKDPEWSVGIFKTSTEGARQEIYKRAALAIERPELQSKLNKAERAVMDIMKEHFDDKRIKMENPSIYGNKAGNIFPGSRFKGTYVPNVYSREAKELYARKLGSREELQDAITASWMTSYRARPEVKARIDEHLAEVLEKDPKDITEEMVEKYGRDKAYGISHTDEFDASAHTESTEGSITGVSTNSYLKARNLFDSDMPVTLPNGEQFSVNDLRDYDMRYIMPSYDRHVNGDIAIMGGTGKTTSELVDYIAKLEKEAGRDGKARKEVNALKEAVKVIAGRARRDPDGLGETMLRTLTDLSFFTKNAYMAAQNITEIGGMLAKGNVGAMLKGIPYLRDLTLTGKAVSPKELEDIHASLFGKELDDGMRPGRADIIERLSESTGANPVLTNVVGTAKYATQELAARSPLTKWLSSSTNYILDAGRQGMLGDIIKHTMTGKGADKWLKGDMLKAASITKEQWEGIQALIKENVTREPNGRYVVKDKRGFSNDPRAMDLWRMANRVAEETMLRPHTVSNQDTKATGALFKLATQFKSFTMKSINSKLFRSANEIINNHRYLDTALAWSISSGLAGSYYVMQAHVKAQGLPETQRESYLEKALDPRMIAFAAASRSSHLGAPMSVGNLLMAPFGFDQGNMMRSSILPKEKPEKQGANKPINSKKVSNDIAGIIGEQVPALGVLGAVGSAGKNLAGVVTSRTNAEKTDYMTGLMNAHRELVPNDPFTQSLLIKIYEANGVHIKSH